MSDFKSLALAPQIHRALGLLGYTTPTPIQAQAIPDVLKGRDLMGIAQTGTGKTAAFALPTLSHICTDDRPAPKRSARVLVLAPTRELASQIAVSFRDYGRTIEGLSVTCVFGGVPISRQIKKLVGGNDVLVATPGRLIDLIERKAVTLKDIEVLILDEADQMMDMGFIHALRKIVPLVPKKRQTLFFSATMVPAIKKLAGQFLTNPVTIDFDDDAIGKQRVEIVPSVRDFRERLASARTFARLHEVSALQEAGLSKGGSLENAIIVDGDKVLNPEGLRFSDEFVRHKALDLLGDLYLGGPILGRVTTVKGGHAVNHALLMKFYGTSSAWSFVSLPAETATDIAKSVPA